MTLICAGCGSTDTIEELRAKHPKALSCCPEREMIPAPLTWEERGVLSWLAAAPDGIIFQGPDSWYASHGGGPVRIEVVVSLLNKGYVWPFIGGTDPKWFDLTEGGADALNYRRQP